MSTSDQDRTREKVSVWVGAAGVVALAIIGVCYLVGPRIETSDRWLRETLHLWLQLCYTHTLFDKCLLIGIPILLALEWWFPAESRERFFSVGLAHDSVWFLLEGILRVGLVTIYVDWLCRVYDAYCGRFTLHALATFPAWARLAAAFALSDFLGWLHHFVRHKVPLLWHFHAVHHSQRELNQFTDLRYHVVDYVLSQPIVVFPFKFLAIDAPTVTLFVLAQIWYTRFYHSNVRTNLGWLRFLLVTPQSHRVHHSRDPRHFDTNFGVHTCLWDRLFGTQFHGANEYPATGIDDPEFPLETKLHGMSLIATPMRQLVYPFVALWRIGMGRRSPGDQADVVDFEQSSRNRVEAGTASTAA